MGCIAELKHHGVHTGGGSLTVRAHWDGTVLLAAPVPHPLLVQPGRGDTRGRRGAGNEGEEVLIKLFLNLCHASAGRELLQGE